MAFRDTKQTKSTVGYRSEKNLPQRKYPVQTITNTKPSEQLQFCQCVCKKCGHRKHEKEEQALKRKLQVSPSVQQISTTKPISRLMSPQSRNPQEARHRLQQTRAEEKEVSNTCCNGGCCCCKSYKRCPNTSLYQDMEADRVRKQQNLLKRQQAERYQDIRQNRPNIIVEDYDRKYEAELDRRTQANTRKLQQTQTKKRHHDNKQRFTSTSPPQNRHNYTEHIVSDQYGHSQYDRQFNHHKQSQLRGHNQKAESSYRVITYDYAPNGQYKQDSYHCPFRLPNHRDYQWENRVVPERYYCKCPGYGNSQHYSHNRQLGNCVCAREARQCCNKVGSPIGTRDNRVQFNGTNKFNLPK